MGAAAQDGATPMAIQSAIAQAEAALTVLADVNPTGLTTIEQADCLVVLERLQSRLLAARTAILAAFTDRRGFADDGHGSARTWLTWRTRITRSAATAATSWARRLAAHPAVRC
ncbi:MAG: hypothetical protein ACYCPF_14325, partial [Streptosporangiaceae bacterium]